MKKLLITLSILLLSIPAFAQLDYDVLYEHTEHFPSKLYNNIDPFQDEDTIKYTWSPYPLFRTSTELYFKDITIPVGYYLLTPRNLGGKDYIFFKENGKVSYIIPVAKKEQTPINFYEANTPQIKKTKWQKFTSKVKTKFYNTAKNSLKSEPPKSLIDVQVEVKYIVMTLYYGEDKYIVLFKRSPY